METVKEILQAAQARAKQKHLPYEGALTPAEAYQIMTLAPQAKLVDVRTQAEWNYVGTIPDSVRIEWQTYPDGRPNPHFLSELKQQVNPEGVVMFICRSGVRSHAAAVAATQAGYRDSYNVLEGFQGDKDANRHRDSIGGWRNAGLPWVQD
jgi:rhodanese-related sulfurtransferase